MADDKLYIPILKGKEGEFTALKCLKPTLRANITPFIDIPRRDLDLKTNKPKGSIDAYLDKKVNKISKCWGTDQKIFVDVFDLDLNIRLSNGKHFVEFLFSRFRDYGVKAIPVIGLDRSTDTEYVDAIKTAVLTDKRGICIRLLKDDMESITNCNRDITDLIKTMGLSKNNVHLLMDFRDISENDLMDVRDIALDFLAKLPNQKDWKTIILSASGFPENLGVIKPQSIGTIKRVELDLRDALVSKKKNIPRFPIFSDYGICHPDILDFDPRKHKRSAAIRYTVKRGWLILKAGSLKKYSFEQFRGLSDKLRRRSEYCGLNYSWGDKYINDCADYCTKGPGSLTIWRQVGTNHHITFVVDQIANSPSI